MHRGTTIQDAGYKQGASWPFVPDILHAREASKHIRNVLIATLPAMAISYGVMFFNTKDVALSFIAPAGVLIAAVLMVLRLRKVRYDLLLNCKMIKTIAGYADTEIEHTATVIFDAVSSKDGVERIAPLNDEYGVYVNSGYKLEKGGVESPYIIFIRKIEHEIVAEQAEAA